MGRQKHYILSMVTNVVHFFHFLSAANLGQKNAPQMICAPQRGSRSPHYEPRFTPTPSLNIRRIKTIRQCPMQRPGEWS
ncbi:hypothetical protein H4582DRAFT_1958656, partial [Lactarius indigo]